MNEMKIPYLDDKNKYIDLLCELFNMNDNIKTYSSIIIPTVNESIFIHSSDTKTLIFFILIEEQQKNDIEILFYLINKLNSVLLELNNQNEVIFEKLIFASTFEDNETLKKTIKNENLSKTYQTEYFGWQTLTMLFIKHKKILKKYFSKHFEISPSALGELNYIKIDGDENIIAQDINNSFVIINKTNTNEFEKFFKLNIDKLDAIEKLIKRNEQSNTKDILLKILIQTTPRTYSEERNIYNEKLRNLFHENIMNEIDISLKDIYVEPNFLIYQSSFEKNDERRKKINTSGFIEVNHSSNSIHSFLYETLQNKNTLKLLEIPNVTFILGYPGQGKTSLCKKTLNDLLTTKIADKDIYFFRLKDIHQIKQLISNPIPILLEVAEKNTFININKLDFAKSILILDGLDELYMKENLKLDEIDEFCKVLINETKTNSELKIILTSRYHYVDIEKFQNDSVLILQIKEFNFEQQQQWIKLYKEKKHYHKDWFQEEINKYNFDPKYVHLKELTKQPLLLYLISSIKTNLDKNTNRAKIYSLIFEELIERHYDGGKLRAYENIDKEDLRQLIQEIAFAIFKSNKEYINKTELLKSVGVIQFLTKFRKEYHSSLKSILSSFYFQEIKKETNEEPDESRSNYTIEFLHKSLQEYMVAEKIYENLKLEFSKKDEFNQYVINDIKVAFEQINPLFQSKKITNEIIYNLQEIALNDTSKKKGLFYKRLIFFLPDLLKFDFLQNHSSINNMNPIELIKNTFWGYISILTSIKPNKTFTDKIDFHKFKILFHLIQSDYTIQHNKKNYTYQNNESLPFSMSKQLPNISQFYSYNPERNEQTSFYNINNLEKNFLLYFLKIKGKQGSTCIIDTDTKFIDIHSIMNDIKISSSNKNFSNQNLKDKYFLNYDFFKCNFSNTKILNSKFIDTVIDGANFKYAEITETQFKYMEIKNVNFSNTKFTNTEFIRTSFKNVSFNNSNLQSIGLHNVSFDNCLFENADLRNNDFEKDVVEFFKNNKAII